MPHLCWDGTEAMRGSLQGEQNGRQAQLQAGCPWGMGGSCSSPLNMLVIDTTVCKPPHGLTAAAAIAAPAEPLPAVKVLFMG